MAYAGTCFGITGSYGLGRLTGHYLHKGWGRYIGLTEKRYQAAHQWFEKMGKFSLSIGYFYSRGASFNWVCSGCFKIRISIICTLCLFRWNCLGKCFYDFRIFFFKSLEYGATKSNALSFLLTERFSGRLLDVTISLETRFSNPLFSSKAFLLNCIFCAMRRFLGAVWPSMPQRLIGEIKA